MATATAAAPRRTTQGHLSRPFTPAENRTISALYIEHRGLIRLIGRKMCRKYPYVFRDDIYSCIDIAFLKTCRVHNDERGTLSTCLTIYANGEILHFIRDSNWLIKAPGKVRALGQRVRRLIAAGHTVREISAQLTISEEAVRDSLLATRTIDHEVRGFDLHPCSRQTPWEVLAETAAT